MGASLTPSIAANQKTLAGRGEVSARRRGSRSAKQHARCYVTRQPRDDVVPALLERADHLGDFIASTDAHLESGHRGPLGDGAGA